MRLIRRKTYVAFTYSNTGSCCCHRGIFPVIRRPGPLLSQLRPDRRCQLAGLSASASLSIATFVATVIVILLSRWFAVREHCPVTIFLISGIIPLVPGAGIYRAAYYTVTNQLYLAVQTGFDAVKMAVAIVLGIVFVFEIPQAVFRIGSRGK